MKAVAAFLLVLCYLAISASAWTCTNGPLLPNARQIDAGMGKVVALDGANHAYSLIESRWQKLSDIKFMHVSVGPAGLWAVGVDNRVYKYVAGSFEPSSGLLLRQVDAGGDLQVVGVTTNSIPNCLRSRLALANSGGDSLAWTALKGSLNYYSCSPYNGCWGLKLDGRIYYTQNLNSTTCRASDWTLVPNKLVTIEVGTDGSVFGRNVFGGVIERIGFSSSSPYGTAWNQVRLSVKIIHVSYDLGKLWVVATNGLIMHCERGGQIPM